MVCMTKLPTAKPIVADATIAANQLRLSHAFRGARESLAYCLPAKVTRCGARVFTKVPGTAVASGHPFLSGDELRWA